MSRIASRKFCARAGAIATFALSSLAWFASSLPPSASAVVQDRVKVYGAIADKWKELRGAAGPLGAARTDEADAARGGRFNQFEHGFIYWHPRLGAHAVYGDIGVKWNQMERERGLGYPVTDELPAFGKGRYNDFENSASIYWSPTTGAHAVYGFIRTKWLSVGGVRKCGYPKTDEYTDGNFRRSDFQHGSIRWSKQTGAKLSGCVTIDDGPALNPVPN